MIDVKVYRKEQDVFLTLPFVKLAKEFKFEGYGRMFRERKSGNYFTEKGDKITRVKNGVYIMDRPADAGSKG